MRASHTDPDAVRSKKPKNASTWADTEHPPDSYAPEVTFFDSEGWGKELQSTRKERKGPLQRKTRQQVDEDSKKRKKKSSTDLNAELRCRPGAQQVEKSPLVDWEGWQEHSHRRKEKGKTSSRASPTGKTKSTRKKWTEDDEIDMNAGEQALHRLAHKLNGLAPKRANSASVRRRKMNNPSLESLSSCQHEELAIDGVRLPRATQAVLEPGAIIYTL